MRNNLPAKEVESRYPIWAKVDFAAWDITTDPETIPPNYTSFVKTNLKGKIKKILGNLYGLRTWVEYGFRPCK